MLLSLADFGEVGFFNFSGFFKLGRVKNCEHLGWLILKMRGLAGDERVT